MIKSNFFVLIGCGGVAWLFARSDAQRACYSYRVFATLARAYLALLAFYLFLRITVGDGFWGVSLLNTFAPFWFVPLPLALTFLGWKRWWPSFALASGLSLVALFWFGGGFLPKPVPVAAGPTFKVVNFNMRASPEGLEPWLREVQPDLVLLQEVPQAYPAQALESLNDLYPFQQGQAELYKGNLVLSRYPVSSSAELSTLGDYVTQRLVVEVAGTPVAVYNVHLSWPIGSRRLPRDFTPGALRLLTSFDDRRRNAEVAQLAQNLADEPLPFVAAGDFNLSQHAVTYGVLAKVAKDAHREIGRGFGNTWRLRPNLPLPLRIDYLWHSAGLTPVRMEHGPTFASDHVPLVTELSLNVQDWRVRGGPCQLFE
ncbi:hypothetical protein BH24DEI2_BH24DEI2_14520 [soil metagenome]